VKGQTAASSEIHKIYFSYLETLLKVVTGAEEEGKEQIQQVPTSGI
jgi:hypothetical protein